MSLMLECPHCQDCHSIKDWNNEVANSIALNRAEELIPEDLVDYDDWEDYKRKHGSSMVDCPSCEQVCIFEDISAA